MTDHGNGHGDHHDSLHRVQDGDDDQSGGAQYRGGVAHLPPAGTVQQGLPRQRLRRHGDRQEDRTR